MHNIFETFDTTSPPIVPDLIEEEGHEDHYIEPEHHGTGEYYPRRTEEQFQAIEGFFPKQDIMLVDISIKTKKLMSLEFKYSNNEIITREFCEGDIVRVSFIQQSSDDKSLKQLIGKVYYIDFNYNWIRLDYSESYEAKHVKISINNIRFISRDLDEKAPFEVYENQVSVPFRMDYYGPRLSMAWNQIPSPIGPGDKPTNYPDDVPLVFSNVQCNTPQKVFEPIMYTKPIIQ